MEEESFSNEPVDLKGLPDYQAVEYEPVELKLQTKSALLSLILLLLFMAGLIALYFTEVPVFSLGIAAGGILLVFAVRFFDIYKKQPNYGYAIRQKDLLFRKGYIYTQIKVVPFNRIQHSAIHRSFWDKLFGLAQLKVYTAGGSGSDLNIPGLLPEKAKQLNEWVAQNVAEYEY